MLPTPDLSATPLPKLSALQNVWRVVYVCLGGIAGLAVGGLAAWIAAEQDVAFGGLSLCVLLPVLILAAFGWFYAGKRFSLYRAHLHEGQGVALQDGVWWRSEAWVPIARLQYLDVSQGPLDRAWGMASLSLKTASSHDHTTRIAGLPVQEAHALRAALLPLTRGEHE
jgi:membrane protein YdbS with pleckstrin-like domain